MVETTDGTQLRVVTSPAENVAQGAPVWLYPAARALPGVERLRPGNRAVGTTIGREVER